MNILNTNINKFTNIFKYTFTRAIEFYKFDELSKIDTINDCIDTKSVKDTPHVLYSNQIKIEQL